MLVKVEMNHSLTLRPINTITQEGTCFVLFQLFIPKVYEKHHNLAVSVQLIDFQGGNEFRAQTWYVTLRHNMNLTTLIFVWRNYKKDENS